jgi:hypothetical protein
METGRAQVRTHPAPRAEKGTTLRWKKAGVIAPDPAVPVYNRDRTASARDSAPQAALRATHDLSKETLAELQRPS